MANWTTIKMPLTATACTAPSVAQTSAKRFSLNKKPSFHALDVIKRRELVEYDKTQYVVHHYTPDTSKCHQMRGHSSISATNRPTSTCSSWRRHLGGDAKDTVRSTKVQKQYFHMQRETFKS